MLAKLTSYRLYVWLVVCSSIIILYHVGNEYYLTNSEFKIVPRSEFTENSLRYNFQNDFFYGKQVLNSSNKSQHRKCVTEKEKYQDNYRWIIRPEACDKIVSVLLLIKSSIVRNSLRHAIRKTWGQNINDSKIGHVKRIFLVGSTTDNSKTALLKKESEIERDIVQGNFEDTFRSVSHKLFTGFNFVKHYCPKVKLIIVVDDDAIILPWNLFSFLNFDYKMTNVFDTYLGGFIWKGVSPSKDKDSLYYVSELEYNCSSPVPPYPSGTVYVLSYDNMVKIYHLACAIHITFTDDIFVGIFADIAQVHVTEFPMGKLCVSKCQLEDAHTIRDISGMIALHGIDNSLSHVQMWTEICYSKTYDILTTDLLLNYCLSVII